MDISQLPKPGVADRRLGATRNASLVIHTPSDPPQVDDLVHMGQVIQGCVFVVIPLGRHFIPGLTEPGGESLKALKCPEANGTSEKAGVSRVQALG